MPSGVQGTTAPSAARVLRQVFEKPFGHVYKHLTLVRGASTASPVDTRSPCRLMRKASWAQRIAKVSAAGFMLLSFPCQAETWKSVALSNGRYGPVTMQFPERLRSKNVWGPLPSEYQSGYIYLTFVLAEDADGTIADTSFDLQKVRNEHELRQAMDERTTPGEFVKAVGRSSVDVSVTLGDLDVPRILRNSYTIVGRDESGLFILHEPMHKPQNEVVTLQPDDDLNVMIQCFENLPISRCRVDRLIAPNVIMRTTIPRRLLARWKSVTAFARSLVHITSAGEEL